MHAQFWFTPGSDPRSLNVNIRSDEGLALEMSAFQLFHCGNSTFISSFDKSWITTVNSFDKTKFSWFTLPLLLLLLLLLLYAMVKWTSRGRGNFVTLIWNSMQSWKYKLIHCAWFILSLFNRLYVGVCCRVVMLLLNSRRWNRAKIWIYVWVLQNEQEA